MTKTHEAGKLDERLAKGMADGKDDEQNFVGDIVREAIITTAFELALPGSSQLALQAGKGLKPVMNNTKNIIKKGAKPFVKNAAEAGIKKISEEEEPQDTEENPANSLATELGENVASEMLIQGISKKLGR